MPQIDVHSNDLALFQLPKNETGTLAREWITHRSVNQLTEGAPIEFNIMGTSMSYIDLKNTLLYIKLKIVKADGTDTISTDKVRPLNNLLHSVFSQVDINLHQQHTTEAGSNYAYKAYLDTLLETTDQHELDTSLFLKDDVNDFDDTDPGGKNNGLYLRSKFTELSKEIDLFGRLKVDLCQQDRLIVNGVPIYVKL